MPMRILHKWEVVNKSKNGWDMVSNNKIFQKSIITGTKSKKIALEKLFARHGEWLRHLLTVRYIGTSVFEV